MSLNLIETELVESTFGSIVPVNVMLSPPSKFSVVVGKILVMVQSISSATNWSEFGITPKLLVRIGRWIPHVGSSSKVH